MDDVFRMGCVECVGNLDGQRQNQLRLHRSPADTVLQRRSVKKQQYAGSVVY